MECEIALYNSGILHSSVTSDFAVFLSQVTIVGDGLSHPVVLSGDKLDDWDRLVALGSEATSPGAIKDTASGLSDKLFG